MLIGMLTKGNEKKSMVFPGFVTMGSFDGLPVSSSEVVEGTTFSKGNVTIGVGLFKTS